MFNVVIDPLKKFPNLTYQELIWNTGIITGAVMFRFSPEYEDFKSAIDGKFHLPVTWHDEKGLLKIGDSGEFQYPEDPDLYPFIEFHSDNEILRIYQSAWTVITDKENNLKHWARLD